jgi:hypothetical protein
MTDEGAGTLPTAVAKAYDVLLWLIPHVGKFPRSHRFVLGDRITPFERAASVRAELVEARDPVRGSTGSPRTEF